MLHVQFEGILASPMRAAAENLPLEDETTISKVVTRTVILYTFKVNKRTLHFLTVRN